MTTTNNAAEWLLVNPDIVPISGWQVLNDTVGGRHSYLIEYYKACRAGDIVIGRELKTELESLVQDIVYHGDVYHFELEGAHKRIDFIEREIKHFESPFAGKPFILTLNQKRWRRRCSDFTSLTTNCSAAGVGCGGLRRCCSLSPERTAKRLSRRR